MNSLGSLSTWRWALVPSAAAIVFMSPYMAAAQAPTAAEELTEVVVSTARQRAERLIDVPVAVSTIGAKDLALSGLTDLSAATQLVPQVNISMEAGGLGVSAAIRGVRTPSTEVGLDQSVIFNLDGVPVTRGRIALQGFFDVDRIEVMKGPQALFFGKNATAGVISLASAGPGSEREGYVKVNGEFESHEYRVDAAYGGPINDAWGFRVAGRYRNLRGWVENVAQPISSPFYATTAPELNPLPGALDPWFGEREGFGRLTLTYTPDSPFSASLKVTAGKYKDDGASQARELVDCGPNGIPEASVGATIVRDTFADCTLNGRTSVTDHDPAMLKDWRYVDPSGSIGSETDSLFAALQANYVKEGYTLTSVTGFTSFDSKEAHAGAPSAFDPIPASAREGLNSFSQELRLLTTAKRRLNYMIGAFYSQSTVNHESYITLNRPPRDPVTGRYFDIARQNGADIETVSAFGQLTFDVTDKVELTAGLRWTDESKDSFIGVNWVNPAVTAMYLPVGRYPDTYSDSNVSPEVTVKYRLSDDAMIYGAYKTGFKAGGYAFSVFPVATLNLPAQKYKSETVDGFELGTKMQTGNGLFLTATAYSYDFKDLQVSAFVTATNSFIITNAATARTQGVELESRWKATDHFALRGSIGYNHARYGRFPGAACFAGQTVAQGCVSGRQDLAGKALPQAPEWDGTVGVEFTTPVAGGNYRLGISADVSATSSYNMDSTLPPALLQASFTKFDATVHLESADGRRELALIGRNLSNKWTMASGSAATSTPSEFVAFPARPRSIALEGTIRF